MVQYIHTPWRDRSELLRVRQQFYPSPPSTSAAHPTDTTTTTINIASSAHTVSIITDDCSRDDEGETFEAQKQQQQQQQQHAVSRVSMWMQRGSCPHLVESTALLMAAILSDLHETRTRANSSSYAIRAAYSAAFSRFVTGLLDSQQDKQRKLSMYSIAKTIGLPATFVELRHQATHEQLPSLLKLRSAAKKALVWIWDYYWKNLSEDDDDSGAVAGAKPDLCRELLLQYLTTQNKTLHRQLKQWDEAVLLRTLADISDSSENPRVMRRSLQLSQGILDGSFAASSAAAADASDLPATKDLDAIRAELEATSKELGETEVEMKDVRTEIPAESSSQTKGWSRYEGTWKPKPIGVV